MRHSSTLKELSEILNLSISTVSRALKDHPDISEKTKQKVRELAQSLEYEPNTYAIQLRTNESKVLGIMVPSITNFFYDSFIAAVEEEARVNGYSVLIMQSGESSEAELGNLKLLKRNRVSGLFVSLTKETKDLQAFQKLNEVDIPVVYFDRVPELEGCNKICLADHACATIAAETLIKKEKKQILALFGYPNLTITKKRLEAFTKVFEKTSPQIKLSIAFPDQSLESKAETLKAFNNPEKPDAVFCMGDQILIGVMSAIHQMGLRVPEDISVIAISNGFIPTLYNPKITYVETSSFKLGKLAFNRIMECVHGDSTPKELLVESLLIEGGSI